MKISYDCEELIEELKEDIEEFGENEEMYAFFEELEYKIPFSSKIDKCTFLTNYSFIEGQPLKQEMLKEGTICQIMKAKEILEILEEQNKII